MDFLVKSRLRRGFEATLGAYRQVALAQAQAAARVAERIPQLASPLVLEIGSGAGLLTQLVLGRLRPRIYVALDLSAKLAASEALAEPGPHYCLAADGERPPFRPGRFDLLVSASAMQWYENPETSIRENLELLAPGGFYSLSLFTRGSLAELARAADLSGFGGVRVLPEAARIVEALKYFGPGHKTETITVWHESVEAALHSIKLAGAAGMPGVPRFGKTVYAAFRRAYLDLFGACGRVPLSYQVLYLWGRVG